MSPLTSMERIKLKVNLWDIYVLLHICPSSIVFLVPVLSPPPIERDESLERVPQEIDVDRVDGVKVAEVDKVDVAVEGSRTLRRHDQLHELALENWDQKGFLVGHG